MHFQVWGYDALRLILFSVGSGFRVDSNRTGNMQSGRVESRAVLTLVILTG